MIVWPRSLFEVKETDPREPLTDLESRPRY